MAKRNRKEQILGEKPCVWIGSEGVLQMRTGEAELPNVTSRRQGLHPKVGGPGAGLRRNGVALCWGGRNRRLGPPLGHQATHL